MNLTRAEIEALCALARQLMHEGLDDPGVKVLVKLAQSLSEGVQELDTGVSCQICG